MKFDKMEKEETFKTGHLFIPPSGFLRKNWCKKFCALYKASNHGIQRLEIFDSEDTFYRQSSYKIIPLTDCVKVAIVLQKNQPNVFEVRTKSHTYQFSADNFQEMTEWLSALQTVSFGLSRPASLSSQALDGGIEKHQSVIQHEENMLYSSVDTQVYGIKVIETEASLRCGLQGEFFLVVTSVSISLAEEASQGRIGKVIYTWPYRHIRRYGHSKDSFSFEAGRKCSSGEGLFCFISKDANIIFQSIDAHVNSLKASQSEIDLQASPSPNFDKNSSMFFNRQSVISSNGLQISPTCRRKTDNTEEKLSNECSDNNSKSGRQEKLDIPEDDKRYSSKPPFAKPPRKSKIKSDVKVYPGSDISPVSSLSRQSSISYTSEHLYENPATVDKKGLTKEYDQLLYDEPEERTEAWKTHGRDVDDDTEKFQNHEEPEYAILEERETKESNSITVATNQLKQTHLAPVSNVSTTENLIEKEYDHLALKRYQPVRYPNIPVSNHVYGKLITTQSGTNSTESSPSVSNAPQYSNITDLNSVTADLSEHDYEQLDKSSRDYENVVAGVHTTPEQPSASPSPTHFVQNGAEYAQVIKKK